MTGPSADDFAVCCVLCGSKLSPVDNSDQCSLYTAANYPLNRIGERGESTAVHRLGNWRKFWKYNATQSGKVVTKLVARGEEIRLYLQGTNFDAKLKNPPDDKGQGLPKHGIFSV